MYKALLLRARYGAGNFRIFKSEVRVIRDEMKEILKQKIAAKWGGDDP